MSIVSATILAQLGNNKFIAMTGAKNLMGWDTGLSMQLPGKLPGGANRFRIDLMADDTYTLTLSRYRKSIFDVIRIGDPRTGVHCDNLCSVFESMTGLRTSL